MDGPRDDTLGISIALFLKVKPLEHQKE